MEDGNTIETIEKYETKEDNKDELEKAMELFGLVGNQRKVKSNGKRK